jgi:hypothetical protein
MVISRVLWLALEEHEVGGRGHDGVLVVVEEAVHRVVLVLVRSAPDEHASLRVEGDVLVLGRFEVFRGVLAQLFIILLFVFTYLVLLVLLLCCGCLVPVHLWFDDLFALHAVRSVLAVLQHHLLHLLRRLLAGLR